MRKAIILAAGAALLATSASGQSSWRDRDDDRRGWREERREGGRDRDEMRGRSMRDDDEGGRSEEGGRSRPARFALRSGDARLAVRCDDRESMRACLDATLTLFDKIRTQAATSGSTAPASPPTTSSPTPAQ
jgi:hypothetical protein